MLAGEQEHCLDGKNRIRIPAKFKAELGDDFVFCRGVNKCIYVIAKEEFASYVEDFKKIGRFDRVGQRAVSEFMSSYAIPEIDNQGRMILPKKLREYAEIDKNVVTIGAYNRLEIWSAEVLARQNEENEDIDYADILAERLKDL
ncbi:MAG: division/cell wall cluster transcriptional repressor MraZ [Clostridia bacterium]|nr:division/cell wall cluster transcriptional repressor MraZ [Clostridia bacterium]